MNGGLVVQRVPSPFSELFLAVSSSFPLAFPWFGAPSVLVSISRFEMRILDFKLEMSLGHQLQSAIIILHFSRCHFLSVDLHTKYFNFYDS